MRAEFDLRIAEITRYFQFIEAVDSGVHSIMSVADGANAYRSSELTDLVKTLKANGFVVLYNLVEATLKNAIEAIFDELESKSVDYDQCRDEIQRVILKNVKKRNTDNLLPFVRAIASDIAAASFRKDELFAGNLDARRIRQAATEYGFTPPAKKSDELLTVKEARNDLAHGDKSFAEVGRDFDVARLLSIKTEVIEYLEDLLNNIDSYLSNESYLRSNSLPT